MYNPFYPFTNDVFNALQKKGYRYYVMNGYMDISIITHYMELSKAEAHYNSHNDKNDLIIYDSGNTGNHNKLIEISNNAIANRIFSTFFYPSYLKFLNDNNRRKIKQRLMNEKIHYGDDINVDFYVHFGCLYVKVSSKRQELNFNFIEIEK